MAAQLAIFLKFIDSFNFWLVPINHQLCGSLPMSLFLLIVEQVKYCCTLLLVVVVLVDLSAGADVTAQLPSNSSCFASFAATALVADKICYETQSERSLGLNLANPVVEFSPQQPQQKFTARPITRWLFATYRDECRQKQKGFSADLALLGNGAASLTQAGEIDWRRLRRQHRHPKVKSTAGGYWRSYVTESTGSAVLADAGGNQSVLATKTNEAVVKEHDLYPLLSQFLWSELELYSKRIDEKRSRNSRGAGGNKWLYPDLVSMEDLSSDWHREIKDFVQQYAAKKTRLWSFEVKISLNRGNVREAFFQTISNSSWAHFGYLVASEIEDNVTWKELRMLADRHGIGFIRLDADNPSESQIMIPARERTAIDWDAANRLAEANKDFLEFIKLIRQFYQSGELRQSDWGVNV